MQYKFKAVLSYKCVFIYKHACLHACIHMHICICTFVVALIAKSCPTLFRPRGLKPLRLLCPLDCPGKNTRGSCHALLQGIFLTQGLNPLSPALQKIIYHWTIGVFLFRSRIQPKITYGMKFSCLPHLL